MAFMKHVGRHNNKKVVIVFRENPETPGMASVLYSDALPQRLHGEVMAALESETGQNEGEFGMYLYRIPSTSSSGMTLLETLAADNYIRQAPIREVTVTPNTQSSMRLDELLEHMKKTPAELSQADAAQGMRDTRKLDGVLTDEDIADQTRQQIERMRNEAAQLTAEADRMEAELTPAEEPTGESEPQPTTA